MTIFAESGTATERHTTERKASVRHYVMTPPRFFAVDYAINPWMDTTNPVDTAVALAQWQQLQDVYGQLGHHVDQVDPVPGLPDMVYAANRSQPSTPSGYGRRVSNPFELGTSTKARAICCRSARSSWPDSVFEP